jgi:hypothetical protein
MLRKCAVALLVLLFAAQTVSAQLSGGAISGTITDSSGAIIPNAEIVIEKLDTHEARNLVSSSTGLYNAPNLGPGLYRIGVNVPGFGMLERSGVRVEVGSQIVLDLQLQVGAAAESVEVTADAPVVEAGSSQIGAVNNGQTVRELPLNGRDWTSLAALQPGVSVVRTEAAVGTGLANTRGNRGLGQMMSIAGSRPQQNSYRLDGVSLNDYAGSGPASVIGASLGVDAIQEFSVITGNAGADYGKTSGGVLNAVTRSGTNDYHGSAYEFLRNSALDARNFFDGPRLPPFKRNQFGGSLGGPIRRDRTFFFTDYEGLRQGLGITSVDTVPSEAAHHGQLAAGTVGVDSKVAPYLALFPLPNGPVKGDAGTYTFNAQDITRENYLTTRVDHRFSDKDLLHGTYLIDRGTTEGPDAFNFVLDGTLSRRQVANIEESRIFSPSVVNFARLGVNRAVAEQVASIAAINPAANDPRLGFVPGRNLGQINIGGFTLFLGGVGAIGDYHFDYTSYQAYDDLSITRGNHSIKIGGAFERIHSNVVGAGASNGTATFGTLTAFLQNQPSSFAANVPGTGSPLGQRQSVFGAYVQDDWRARHNITLNLGLRYEGASVPTEAYNRLATLTSLSSPVIHLGSPYFQNPTRRNFAPRAGFAWTPFVSGRTVVRGAFGIYDSLPLTYEFALLSSLSAPYLAQGSSASVTQGSFPDQLYGSVAAGALRTAFLEQNPKRNYVEQWNLNVQEQIGSDVLVEAAYAGSHGVHSPFLSSDVNTVQPALTPQGYVWPLPQGSGVKPLPSVGNVTALFWQVSSTYHALRTRIQKRMARGWQIQGAYTWAKSLDTGSASIQTAYTNTISSLPLFDARIRKAPSDFDVRHTLSVNSIWEVPAWRTSVQPLAWLESGWQLGTIWQTASGLPFTPTISGDALGLNSSIPYDFPDRLNLPGCGNPINPGNPVSYIKLECFAAPTPITRLGNAGRNVMTGPGLVNVDLSLVRNINVQRISEVARVQFRAEIFNILNHTNFSPPTAASAQLFGLSGKGSTAVLNAIPSAGFLNSTSTSSRQIQFALKLSF